MFISGDYAQIEARVLAWLAGQDDLVAAFANGEDVYCQMAEAIWNRPVKKGDKVTAVVSPLKNGEPGSLLTRITLPDGRVLGNGGPAGVGPGTTEPAAGRGR